MKDKVQAAIDGKIEDVREAYASWNHGNVMSRHAIGKLISEMKTNDGKYGVKAIEKVAKSLDVSASWLYASAEVFEAFTEKELEKWLGYHMGEREQPLCWSHFRIVAALVDKATRDELLERALNESMTVQQLKAVVDGEPQPAGDDLESLAAGQKSIGKGLRSARALAEASTERASRWRQFVVEPLEAGEKLEGEIEAEARKTLAAFDAAKDHYTSLANDLRDHLKD